jgi:spore coat protein CotF
MKKSGGTTVYQLQNQLNQQAYGKQGQQGFQSGQGMMGQGQQGLQGQQGFQGVQGMAGQQGGMQTMQGFQGQQQMKLQEQDLANILLCELKRVAREYATATLEASNPQIRQMFHYLLNQTLQDQAQLFQDIQQMNQYGDIPTAQRQDVQKELQKHSQTTSNLQSMVQQTIGSAGFGQQQGYGQPSYQQGGMFGGSFMPNAAAGQNFGQNPGQQQGFGQQPSYATSGIGSPMEFGQNQPSYSLSSGIAGNQGQNSTGDGAASFSGAKSAKESAGVFSSSADTGTSYRNAGPTASHNTKYLV